MAGVVSPALARIVFQIYVPSVLMGFGLGMLLPTLPILARSFGVAPEVAAQAVTALLVGRTVSYFPWGYVVDRFGRRAAMAAGPLVVVAGVLTIATTPWFGLVLVGMTLVGSGEGLWSLGREIAAVAFAAFAPLHLVSAVLVTLVARETLNRMPPPEPRPVAERATSG